MSASLRRFEKVLLVVNPTSGGARAGRWAEPVAQALRDRGADVETVLTQRAGDGEAAARACAGRNTLIVTFGGDGTVNEVLNGADLAQTALAVIPAGTGNVLAKELGMARRPLEAARQIARGRAARLDVGVCNGRRFLCMFGAGLDARVVQLVHERRGGSLTQLHYLAPLARTVLGEPPWRVDVELDGRPLARGLFQVNVGNTHSYGGPLEMTPAARPDDGLLDVACIPRLGLPDLACVAVSALFRATQHSRLVRYARGRRAAVTAQEEGVPYQVDGEYAGQLPADVSLLPGAARLIVPPGFTCRADDVGR